MYTFFREFGKGLWKFVKRGGGIIMLLVAIMILLPQVLLLTLLLSAVVGIPAAAILWAASKPPQAPPPTPTAAPDSAAPAPPHKAVTPMRILPKGLSIMVGVADSVAIALLVTHLIYMILWWWSPVTMTTFGFQSGTLGVMSWLTGIAIGCFVFFAAQPRPIEIGFVGVPLWFGGRSNLFLFPEGDNWTPFGYKPVDMRGRPLVLNPDPNQEEVDVEGLALIPSPATINSEPNAEKIFGVAHAKVGVRVQTFDPILYLSFQDVEGILYSMIKQELRKFMASQNLTELPVLKDEMTMQLQNKLSDSAQEMGINFVKLMVMDIILPKRLTDQALQITIEHAQRLAEKYQAVTLSESVALLRKELPKLGDLELKNMVLTAAGLVTSTNVYSMEGKKGNVIPLFGGQNPNQNHGNHGHDDHGHQEKPGDHH